MGVSKQAAPTGEVREEQVTIQVADRSKCNRRRSGRRQGRRQGREEEQGMGGIEGQLCVCVQRQQSGSSVVEILA
jgi:hypothetical protein